MTPNEQNYQDLARRIDLLEGKDLVKRIEALEKKIALAEEDLKSLWAGLIMLALISIVGGIGLLITFSG